MRSGLKECLDCIFVCGEKRGPVLKHGLRDAWLVNAELHSGRPRRRASRRQYRV